MVNVTAVYVLWLREMKRFFRAKSRLVSSLAIPFFFLIALGFGFSNMKMPGNTSYLSYLIPGIIGMGIMRSSLMAGISVLWDKEFGFLKEIMVSPVSKYSIVIGRVAGNVTTSIIQGIIIGIISLFLGLEFQSVFQLISALLIMVLRIFRILCLMK